MQSTIVLVHGAFAESASWDPVIEPLQAAGHPVIAAANPLRGLVSDAAAVSDLVGTIDGPVVLVGHSYGGAVTSTSTPTPATSSGSCTSPPSRPSPARAASRWPGCSRAAP